MGKPGTLSLEKGVSVNWRDFIPQEYGHSDQVGGQTKLIAGSTEQENPGETEEGQEKEIEDAIEDQKCKPRGIDWIFSCR